MMTIKKNKLFFTIFFVVNLLVWGATNISNSPSVVSTYPQMVVDHAGVIHIVWEEMIGGGRGDIYYVMTNGTSWSRPVNISNNRGINISLTPMQLGIDCDTQNRIYVVWNESNQVYMKIKSGSAWGSEINITRGNRTIDNPRVSVSDSNHVIVAWWTDAGVFAKARINNNWESEQEVNSTSNRAKVEDIHMGSGVVYCVWVRKSGDLYSTYYATRGVGYGSSWSREAVVYNDGHSHSYPRVTITGSGMPYVSFFSYFNGPKILNSVQRSGGGFSNLQAINSKNYLHFPTLYSRGNYLYASWQEGAYENGRGLYYSVYSSKGWSKNELVKDSGGVKSADMATSPDNKKIYFVWDAGGEIYVNTQGGGSGGDDPEPPPPPPPPPNKPPQANFDFNPQSGLYPLTVYFDASGSSDSDGQIVKYEWDLGNGSTATSRNPSTYYPQKGEYIVTLIVTDDDGAKASATGQVTVHGLFPPMNIRSIMVENRNLFTIEYLYKVTWEHNPLNSAVGATIAKYKIFRRPKGSSDYSYLVSVEAKNENEYLDRSMGREKKEYEYNIVCVDVEGRESDLNQNIVDFYQIEDRRPPWQEKIQ